MVRRCLLVLGWFAAALPAAAQEYHASQTDTPAPADALAPEIAKLLAPTGVQVAKGDSQVLCEIWPAKEWPIAADAATSAEVLYPLTPGQVIGVIRYPRRAADFRDQEIKAGVYVLRYGQQPVDGAHVGTSPTRDFLVLLPAGKDRDPQPLDYKALTTISKEVTGTTHPAILSLQQPQEGGQPLAIREDPDHELTILRFTGKVNQGGMAKDLTLELVVVGKAAE